MEWNGSKRLLSKTGAIAKRIQERKYVVYSKHKNWINLVVINFIFNSLIMTDGNVWMFVNAQWLK